VAEHQATLLGLVDTIVRRKLNVTAAGHLTREKKIELRLVKEDGLNRGRTRKPSDDFWPWQRFTRNAERDAETFAGFTAEHFAQMYMRRDTDMLDGALRRVDETMAKFAKIRETLLSAKRQVMR
jgi:hypothetical protein